MLSSSPGAVQVRVVATTDEFASLAVEWEALQEGAAVTNIFSSFDWQHLWWRTYHRGRPLRLLVAHAGGALIGLLPLYIDTVTMLRFPVRLLRLIGSGGDTSPDDLGAVLAGGREREAAAALAEATLRLDGWDVLHFTDMDPACAFTSVMEAAARKTWLGCRRGRSERITYLALPSSFEGWLHSLHRHRRYSVRHLRKKLVASHSVRFFVWSDAATLDQAIDRLIHLHTKRWERAGQNHAFSSPAYIAFHRAVMHACLARDRLRLYCLEIDDQIGAIYYFYRFRDRVYLMQSGFDPDLSDSKPGQTLLGYVVESAIGEGFAVLDFLRGDHRYKDELATGERETVYLTSFRPGVGALIYGTRKRLLPALKARLRRLYDAAEIKWP